MCCLVVDAISDSRALYTGEQGVAPSLPHGRASRIRCLLFLRVFVEASIWEFPTIRGTYFGL